MITSTFFLEPIRVTSRIRIEIMRNFYCSIDHGHSKKDGSMSIIPRSFAENTFYIFKNSHKIDILGYLSIIHQNVC